MARSVNCVHLIGNLTRDPEMRSTTTGRPMCTLGLATNRQWTAESGEKKEETEYHRIVLWGKLAEIASQYLKKGQKTYIQGRIQTRSFTGQDGTQKHSTEIVAEDMMMLSGAPTSRTPTEPSQPAAAQSSQEHEAEDTELLPPSTSGDTEEIPF